jgi:hypothetical protein
MIADGERVTIAAVAELELALEVGAPQIVGRNARRQWRAVGAMTRPANAVDHAVPVQDGVDGALGGDANIAV